MPLFQKRSKKPRDEDEETAAPAESGKPSIAIAYGVQKKNRKKMADGGMADKESVGTKIGYPGQPKPEPTPKPKNYADGGAIQQSSDAMKGMVDRIMQKRKMASGGMVDTEANSEETPASPSPYDEDNADLKELYDEPLDAQLGDSSEPGNSSEIDAEIHSDAHDMVSAIRRKIKARL